MDLNLSVNIGKLKLKNPVMVASGTFGYGEEYSDLIELNKLGAIVTKTITLEPRQGNLPPRIVETPSGMLNAIGLENSGVRIFCRDKLPFLKKTGIPVIVSIAGKKVSDYVELTKRLSPFKEIAALELNISCPNIEKRYNKLMFAQDEKATHELVNAVRKATKLTVITKLSPNVTDIVSIAKSACEAGTDAVSLVNTFLGMAVDIETKKPELGNTTGGLSGPSIKPIALRMVWEVAKEIDVPVIGMGGIITAQDALEFVICGATAVSVGTGNFVNPAATIEILDGIKSYMKKKKIDKIEQLRGSISY